MLKCAARFLENAVVQEEYARRMGDQRTQGDTALA